MKYVDEEVYNYIIKASEELTHLEIFKKNGLNLIMLLSTLSSSQLV